MLKVAAENRALAEKNEALAEAAKATNLVFDVRYQGNPDKAFAARVVKSRDDGTFDVAYDDGDHETRVSADRIRARSDG